MEAFMEAIDWFFSNQGGAALLGAVVGGGLAILGEHLIERRQLRQRRIAASMCVANDLRHWMSQALGRLYDVRNHESSDGHAGELHYSLKDFRFEAAPERISILDPRVSRLLFELIRDKDNANSDIAGTLEFAEPDDALDVFRGRSGALWIQAAEIYREICGHIGWPYSEPEHRLSLAKAEVERLRTIDANKGEFHDDIFGTESPTP